MVRWLQLILSHNVILLQGDANPRFELQYNFKQSGDIGFRTQSIGCLRESLSPIIVSLSRVSKLLFCDTTAGRSSMQRVFLICAAYFYVCFGEYFRAQCLNF